MKTAHYFQIRSILVCLTALLIAEPVLAIPAQNKWVVENQYIKLVMIARTPEQMAAFYEARGFPKTAIQALGQMCFITTSLRNKSQKVIWMTLANWKFTSKQGPLKRFHRNELKARWQKIGLAQQYQSTFRWTLIPEVLDYRPGEREGGNFVLQRTAEPFSFQAQFAIGAEEDGQSFSVQIKDLRCAED
ncbi:hypothetical protein MNBD_GAMMA24-1586 [hydrothermal vent metagenome]|uniref:Uncharacterized protein n=1 Tax=hydrothermal vent metagenome TaxID=652676 RepID=A0A3B1BN89_9ZZZZ